MIQRTGSLGISRDATAINFTQDWTRSQYVNYPTASTGTDYYVDWFLVDGGNNFIDVYAWQLSGVGPFGIAVDINVGGILTSPVFSTPIDSAVNIYVTFRYTASSHLLEMLLDNAVIGSTTFDLSGFPSSMVTDAMLNDGGSISGGITGFDRIWNAVLTDAEIQDEMNSPIAVRNNSLFSDTPLTGPLVLNDISGNGHDWASLDTLVAVSNPRFNIFTDQFIMGQIQSVMIEPDDGGQTWPSQLWTMDEVISYLNQRQNRFFKNTHFQFGIANIAATAGTRTYDLPDDWINSIRVLWITSDGATKELTRSDLWEADNGIPTWSYVQGTPILFYDGGKPITLQLAPVPDEDATLQIHYVPYAALLDGSGELMALPDEFVVPVKYGVMADMLSKVARTQDVRAQYCEQRYAMGVEIAKLLVGGFK